jgi:kumamolisin
MSRVPLPGSAIPYLPGAQIVGPVPASKILRVSVVVRRREEVNFVPSRDRALSHDEFVSTYGGIPNDFLAIREFGEEYGIRVIEERPATRTMILAGTAPQFKEAFAVTLQKAVSDSKLIRVRTEPIQIPEDLLPVVHAVLGLDSRPIASPHYCLATDAQCSSAACQALSPADIASLYNVPRSIGDPKTVAIIELGGGIAQDDLCNYFGDIGVLPPKVTSVSLLGGSNDPGVDPVADGQVMLDIEVVGTVAPSANIVVYFAPNTDEGLLAGINTAIHATPTPAVICIGWGSAEPNWSVQAMDAINGVFLDAAILGVPVCVAASAGGVVESNHGLTADFPSSAPYALSCGGSIVSASEGAIVSETVWNDPGSAAKAGGSIVFPKPRYQMDLEKPAAANARGGRRVPDVCGHAAAWKVRVNGADTVVAGTSAVAALWSGLIVGLAQNMKRRVGFLNPDLYEDSICQVGFRRISPIACDQAESNTPTMATKWNPLTGLGSPRGTALLAALSSINDRAHWLPHPPVRRPRAIGPPPTMPPPVPRSEPTAPLPPVPDPVRCPTPHVPRPPVSPEGAPPPIPDGPSPTPTTTPLPSPMTGPAGLAALERPRPVPYPSAVLATGRAPIPTPTPLAKSIPLPSGGNAVALIGITGLVSMAGMAAIGAGVAALSLALDES